MSVGAAEGGGEVSVDVAVVGGGLAGLATAGHLARRGRRVLCLEPAAWPRPAVGESLEFSAPRLLAELGVAVDDAGESGLLYPKDAVVISGVEAEFELWPPPSFARAPIRCSRVTHHADRTRLDHHLARLAVARGVEIVPERVTQVDHDGDTIRGLVTDAGRRVTATWFVDASGHSCRLFGRALGLDRVLLGPARAALWTRVDRPPEGHATRLFFPDHRHDDLEWAWEIPLNRCQLSLGSVMSAERMAARRSQGRRPQEIFEDRLDRVPRLRHFVRDLATAEIHSTAYTPYRHRRTIGPNWLLVGDASAMVDPLTSNGVTSALRHAEQAARVIATAPADRGIGRPRTWLHEHTVPATVTTVDRAIERFVYRPEVRQRHGLSLAVHLYAATGVITNALYARIGQTSAPRSIASAALLALSRLWIRIGGATVARLPRRRRPAGRGAEPEVAPVATVAS